MTERFFSRFSLFVTSTSSYKLVRLTNPAPHMILHQPGLLARNCRYTLLLLS